MLDTNFLIDALNKHLPHPRKRMNGGINVNCPMCVLRGEPRPDTKFRCGVRFFADGSIHIHCFNCGMATKWAPGTMLTKNVKLFLKQLSVNDLDIKKLNFTAWQIAQNTSNSTLLGPAKSSVFIPDFPEVELPPGAQTLGFWSQHELEDQDFLDVVEYAFSRGEDLMNATEFYWSPDTTDGVNRRLLIPYYWKNKVVGYTGRAIDKNVEPRYYTQTPAHFLFNNQALEKDRKYVILVEGIMDALSIDGVASQGAKLSDEQAQWLKESNKTVIVLPDRDAKGQTMIDIALKHDFMVSIPDWEAGIKDANDAVNTYGKLFTVRSIIDSATANKLEVNLKRKRIK